MLVVIALRVALLLALVGAGWLVYRKLPHNNLATTNNAQASQTALLIIMRGAAEETGVVSNISVKLYPIDIAAARREFFDPDNQRTERRAGLRFDDFLAQRMNGTRPVETRLDEHGQATVNLAPGKWWIHAALAGAQNVEWHLPINVAGRQQTIELTTENAYARTKSF